MSETQTQPSSWRIDTWFPDLDATTLEKMKIYHDELQRASRGLTIVSSKTLGFADVIHFADSILAARLIFSDRPKLPEIYDVGSGGGFPGLVIAMLSPSTKTTIVEADPKKAEFIKHVASLCKLSNVEVVVSAVEKVPANSMSVCVSRSALSISKLILSARQKVPLGGTYYHMKGENWPAEVAAIPTQLCSVWAPALVGEYKLPLGPMKFTVVKTDKIA